MRVYDAERKKYIARIHTQKHCEFCDEKVLKKQSCPSLEGKHWHVMVSCYPYMNGNVMIIPKRHIERLERVNGKEWSDLYDVILKTQNRLTKLFQTNDFNIGLNIGKNSGASIKHLHWQLIPRKKRPLTNALNLFADLQIISVSGDDLKKMIEGNRR